MTTSIDRKALDRAKGLLTMVGGALRNVSVRLAGAAAPEEFGDMREIALLEAELPEVSVALEDAFSYVADGWTEIRDNEVRMYEVFLFVQEYRKFAERAKAFDDVCNGSAITADIFSDVMVGNEYYLLTAKYEKLLRPVLSSVDAHIAEGGAGRYAGLAEALRLYVRRADDEVLAGIVAGSARPEQKLRWTGPLNEATLFGKYFGLTCKWMNDCFAFRSKDGRKTNLNYTHNRLNNDIKEYPIFDILVKFSKGK